MLWTVLTNAVAVVVLHESFVADTASLEVVLPDAAVFGGGAVVISLDCLVVAGTCDLHVAGLCVDLVSFLLLDNTVVFNELFRKM